MFFIIIIKNPAYERGLKLILSESLERCLGNEKKTFQYMYIFIVHHSQN